MLGRCTINIASVYVNGGVMGSKTNALKLVSCTYTEHILIIFLWDIILNDEILSFKKNEYDHL